MLHAWELAMLSEDERQRFEVHLLQCAACANEAAQFATASALLRLDPELRPSVDDLTAEVPPVGIFAKGNRYRVVRYLLVAAVLLVVAIPVYRWTRTPRERSAQVQQLRLVPLRGEGVDTARRELGGTLEIRFFVEGATADQPLRVTVRSGQGRSVYRNEQFDAFSAPGMGLLGLRIDDLDTGWYTLSVAHPYDSLSVIQEYSFRVR
jgi:hypothetical protein